jgi:hypothetical protein
MTTFDEWLRRHIDNADVGRLNEIVIPVSAEDSLGLIDLLRAWWEHLSKFEADLSASSDEHLIWGAHDYIAALILRDLAAKGIARVDVGLRSQIESAVSGIDRRFIDLTVDDKDGCTERVDGRVDPSRGWWWKRIPRCGPIHEEMRLYYGHSAHD